MAFRLKGRRPLGDELSRLLRKEFRRAQQHVAVHTPDEGAIHEARKSLKKIRAVVRLFQGLADLDSEDERLHAASRALSALRDADATGETLRTLQHRYRSVVTPPVGGAVARGLRRRKRQVRGRAGRLLSEATTALDRSGRSTLRRIQKAAGTSGLQAGMARGYRRARKAMHAVNAESNDEDFHAWRRRVKDHWYHVRLLEGLQPAWRARARRLKRLETWLGDDHNLALLRTTILQAPDQFGDARATAVVLGCITKYQALLRRRALASGRRLFSARPRDFRRSIKAPWKRGRVPRASKR